MLAGIAELTARDADQPKDALDAEQWASTILGMMRAAPLPLGEDFAATFLPGFVAALESLGTRKALAALRALASVTAPQYATAARTAADRLAAAGLREPLWAADLGGAQPTAAALICEEAFDDGVSVMVEFDGAERRDAHDRHLHRPQHGRPREGRLPRRPAERGPQRDRPQGAEPGRPRDPRSRPRRGARPRRGRVLHARPHLGPARRRGRSAGARAGRGTPSPACPEGFELPDDYVEITLEERDALLEDFLSSPEGRRWRGDEDAEDVAQLAIDFGAGYNHGGPLRWSPVVVEIFMTSWLARKVAREPGFFERVPEALHDWVKYAGRRQTCRRRRCARPSPRSRSAPRRCSHAVNDPAAWGPAKTFASAALDAGVDLTDPDDVERFLERYNDGLAA